MKYSTNFNITTSEESMKNGEKSGGAKSDETVRILRIHQIDDEIRNGTYPNVPKLAALFEVSDRTISRDLDFMRDQYDAPIEFDRTKNGYYYTDNTFFIKYVPLQQGELFSIALFDTMLKQYRNTPLEDSLKQIFQKIVKSLPETVKVDSSFLSSSVTSITDPLPDIDQTLFTSLIRAVEQKKTVSFKYKPLQKTTYMERKLNPFHILYQRGNWYVLGWCHYSQEVRNFSFSRITDFTCTKETFTVPKDFNVNKHIDPSLGVWVNQMQPVTVKLLFSAEVGTFAAEHQWHDQQATEIQEDGSVLITFATTQMQEVKRLVLGQGPTVTVLEPPELIKEIKDDLQKTARLYGQGE